MSRQFKIFQELAETYTFSTWQQNCCWTATCLNHIILLQVEDSVSCLGMDLWKLSGSLQYLLNLLLEAFQKIQVSLHGTRTCFTIELSVYSGMLWFRSQSSCFDVANAALRHLCDLPQIYLGMFLELPAKKNERNINAPNFPDFPN